MRRSFLRLLSLLAVAAIAAAVLASVGVKYAYEPSPSNVLAHRGSNGGYKVPSLVGLYWSEPYLHDGGVAVGKRIE
jgi:hypothetical protein